MSKKNRLFISLLIGMNVLYFGFICGMNIYKSSSSKLPEIVFDNDIISLSVNATVDDLLSGVSAMDTEDGDISSDVFVYGVSSFNENMERTVTYGVFDSDNQIVKASRKMVYTDYEAPKFSSNKPLVNLSLLSTDDTSYMSATSLVDGNISNKITITKSERDNRLVYRYSVADSTGTTSSFEIADEVNIKGIYANIEIELSDYILYVKKGTSLNFRNYLKGVKTSLGNQDSLMNDVHIESNYKADVPGVYEVKYTLNRTNGDYGISKMLIIVE